MTSNIRVIRVCEFCHKEFLARTTVTRCCSDNCAKRHYKLRKKEMKIEGSQVQTTIMSTMSIEAWKAKEYFSMSDFSKLVGVSRWTLWRAIKRGDLAVVKIGTRIVISRNEIQKFNIKESKHD